MARRSLSRYGAKVADNTSMNHTQPNGYISNPRRSSRLKEITSIYESESTIPYILSAKHQQKTASSPSQFKAETPLLESSHGSPKQKSNVVDIIDIDDESNTSITLMDLLTRCKLKKRKASEVNEQANFDIKEHDNVFMMAKEDEVGLDETISSLKIKKAKSSPTGEKLNKSTKHTRHSLLAEKKTVLTYPLALVAPESGLDEETLKELISDELSVDSEFGPRHNKENVDGKMIAFAEQSPLSVGSPTAFVIKKEVIETCLDGPDDDNSMMNSTTVFVNKCDLDNEYFGEVLDKVSEREDLEQSDNVISNIIDPFLRDIIKQCKHDFSSSFAPRLENCQIPSHDVINVKNKHLVLGSTKCESTAPNVGLLSMFKHHRNIPTEVPQKYTQQELQFEESMSFDERDVHLIAVENPTEFSESDHEKLTCFLENDGWLVENRKDSFSDMAFNKRIVSLVSELKDSYSCDSFGGPTNDFGASLSLENHGGFVDGLNHGGIDKNSCSGAIHSCKNLDIGGDGKCSMVNENCGELVSQSIQSLSTCILSQIDHNIPSDDDTLVSVDAPCSITEAISPYVNPICEDEKQASSHYDGVALGGLKTTDTIADFPAISSLESSTQICVETQINMQTTEIQAEDKKFGGNLCMEVEHSPKKLLSNRKEISPNSQEKLLRALNNGGLDDVVKLSNCMKKLCFDKEATKKPLSSVLDNGETFIETERMIKKPKTMNQSLPEVTKGILKSPDTICCHHCCLKNSSIHAQAHDAILFSQRQMQDTENIATKLLKGLNSLKSIVEETIFSEALTSSPSKLNFDEIRLATKHASKLEATTKKWLAMMAKDCTRFCKIMRLAENKLASPVNDIHKGRKKITFADEAGGALCQVKVYEQQSVAFIFPKS